METKDGAETGGRRLLSANRLARKVYLYVNLHECSYEDTLLRTVNTNSRDYLTIPPKCWLNLNQYKIRVKKKKNKTA